MTQLIDIPTDAERDRAHCIFVLRELLANRNGLGNDREMFERLLAARVKGTYCQPHPLIVEFRRRHRFVN